MTEQEWLEGTTPIQMVRFIRPQATHRKWLLLQCGRYRRMWRGLDERIRDTIDVIERDADGLVDDAVRSIAEEAALQGMEELVMRQDFEAAVWLRDARNLQARDAGQLTGWFSDRFNHRQCDWLRDIFGNPFRPVTVAPAWLTPTVLALAEAIYADRAFDRLPILADALEEASCTHADILAHCRTPGEHVRGCWVVDLVMGRG